MSTHATAFFEVNTWDEAPYDTPPDGPHRSRVAVRKSFSGALEGESTAELLTCQSDPTDYTAGAGYVASERVVGRLDGRSGTFIVQHGGVLGGGTAPRSFGNVVPGSGTGDLAGLRGTAVFTQDADGRHTLTLEYDFG
jgi:hypothetical protein